MFIDSNMKQKKTLKHILIDLLYIYISTHTQQRE